MKNARFPDPMPNGMVHGTDRDLPDRGVTSGVTDTYGADLSGDAINRINGINGMGDAAKSDPWEEDEADPKDSNPSSNESEPAGDTD